MPYLFKARQFAIDHIVNQADENWTKQEKGIFADQYDLDSSDYASGKNFDHEKNKKLSKKLHSLYFPFNWKESVVSAVNVMLLSGSVKNL